MWITNPSVENSRWLSWPMFLVVIDASGDHFLGKSNDIRTEWHFKMFMTPHFAGRSATGLNFVHDQ